MTLPVNLPRPRLRPPETDYRRQISLLPRQKAINNGVIDPPVKAGPRVGRILLVADLERALTERSDLRDQSTARLFDIAASLLRRQARSCNQKTSKLMGIM